jgi:hypothetical protein
MQVAKIVPDEPPLTTRALSWPSPKAGVRDEIREYGRIADTPAALARLRQVEETMLKRRRSHAWNTCPICGRCCASAGPWSNSKGVEDHLAADRTSCHAAEANQFRLFLPAYNQSECSFIHICDVWFARA